MGSDFVKHSQQCPAATQLAWPYHLEVVNWWLTQALSGVYCTVMAAMTTCRWGFCGTVWLVGFSVYRSKHVELPLPSQVMVTSVKWPASQPQRNNQRMHSEGVETWCLASWWWLTFDICAQIPLCDCPTSLKCCILSVPGFFWPMCKLAEDKHIVPCHCSSVVSKAHGFAMTPVTVYLALCLT